MDTAPIELHQFSRSHFNEKARWALDYKNVRHVRIGYIPGAHAPQIKRLSGQSQVPVLRMDGAIVHGSATILDALERRFPAPPLYPADATLREEALALQARFDKELGPEVRRAVFANSLHDAAYITATFASDKPKWKQHLFQATFPLTRIAMRRLMNITPATGARAKANVDVLLNFIAEKSGATGYLVGDQFSVADLTAAALLAPGVSVDHPDMRRPDNKPAGIAALSEEWSAHPAGRWVREIYRKHRPPRRGVLIS